MQRPPFPSGTKVPVGLSGISTPFGELFRAPRKITHVLRTRAPLYSSLRTFSLDLHVLGTPPAFVLSQDQTLQLRVFSMLGLLPKSLSRFTAYVLLQLKECGTAFRIVGLLFSFQRPSPAHATRPSVSFVPDHRDVAKTTGLRQRGSRSTATLQVRQEVGEPASHSKRALSFTSTPFRGQEGVGNLVPFGLFSAGAQLLAPLR